MLIIMDSFLIRVQYIVCRPLIGQVLVLSTNQTLEYPMTVPILKLQSHVQASIRFGNTYTIICMLLECTT